jgi:hypothetical protein
MKTQSVKLKMQNHNSNLKAKSILPGIKKIKTWFSFKFIVAVLSFDI